MRVYKYTLLPGNRYSVRMPEGAQVLCVQIQKGVPQIWVRCDAEKPTELRTFVIAGTGADLPDDAGQYIGTFQMHDGDLVIHVFEEGKAP